MFWKYEPAAGVGVESVAVASAVAAAGLVAVAKQSAAEQELVVESVAAWE